MKGKLKSLWKYIYRYIDIIHMQVINTYNIHTYIYTCKHTQTRHLCTSIYMHSQPLSGMQQFLSNCFLHHCHLRTLLYPVHCCTTLSHDCPGDKTSSVSALWDHTFSSLHISSMLFHLHFLIQQNPLQLHPFKSLDLGNLKQNRLSLLLLVDRDVDSIAGSHHFLPGKSNLISVHCGLLWCNYTITS